MASPSTLVWETPIRTSLSEVQRYHEQRVAFERLLPPGDGSRLVERKGGLEPGARTIFTAKVGPKRIRWVAEHVEHDGRGFTDVQKEGPFAAYKHAHDFVTTDRGVTVRDRVEYRLPLGVLGALVAGRGTRKRLEAMFTHRSTVMTSDLEDPKFGPCSIAVTGGTGLIGTRLVRRLRARGHHVVVLTRNPSKEGEIRWDPNGSWDPSPLEGFDAVIHLAGANISRRWTAANQKRILASRVDGTRNLVEHLGKLERKPKTLVSASAIGFYGDTGAVDETAPKGNQWVSGVVEAWENAAKGADELGIKRVHPRIGIVLSKEGGALAKMLPAFRLGAGGPIGSGKQALSWVSLHDVSRALEFLATSNVAAGVYNLTGPEPLPQKRFAKVLGKVLGRPSFAPLPGFAVKFLFGRMGKELLLEGQQVSNAKLVRAGFKFDHGDLESALRYELGRP